MAHKGKTHNWRVKRARYTGKHPRGNKRGGRISIHRGINTKNKVY